MSSKDCIASLKDFKTGIELLKRSLNTILENDVTAFGPSFVAFQDCQKPEISNSLSMIRHVGTKQLQTMRSVIASYSEIENLYKNIDTLQLELSNAQMTRDKQFALVESTKATRAKTKEYLNNARSRKNPGEIAKYEYEMTELDKKVDKATEAAKNADETFKAFQNDYYSKFSDLFADNLDNWAAKHLKEAQENYEQAEGILNAISTISEPLEDAYLNYEKCLHDLDSEIIE